MVAFSFFNQATEDAVLSAENYIEPAPRPTRLRGILSPLLLPTFDRAFGMAFIKMFLACIVAILSLIVLIDTLEHFDEFARYAKEHDLSSWKMLLVMGGHYAAYAPSLMCQFMIAILPMAAAAIVVTRSCLNREFTLLRAAGISLPRAVMPLVTLTLVFGIVYFTTRDSFVPLILRKSFIMNNQLNPAAIMPLNTALRFGTSQQHVIMGHYEAHEGAAYNITVEMRDIDDYNAGKNNFTVFQAQRAFLQDYVNVDAPDSPFDKQWMPDTSLPAVVKVYKNHRFTTAPWTEPVPTAVRPARLERQVLTDMVMTWSDLLRSRDDLDIQIEIGRRLAEPLMAVAILLVVLPLILQQAARGVPPSYVTNAIICVVVYGAFFAIDTACSSLGTSGTVSPLLASQIANILFIGAGCWLMYRVGR